MRNFVLGFLVAALLGAGGYWGMTRYALLENATVKGTQTGAAKYHCPMHTTYTSDKPGDCPICGMKLVPMESPAETTLSVSPPGRGAGVGERKILYYVDPMNANHRSDKPGKAPDGMDLVPVYADEAAGSAVSEVPGYATVKISPERQQLMGVTLDEARLMPFEQSIRTVGRVAYDETRLHRVHTKFEGFIEEIYVDFTGKYVNKGDALFSVYSPELVATQKEYLLALRARDAYKSLNAGTPPLGIDLVESARQRLSQWDISADAIAEVERTGRPQKALVIYSQVSGFVAAKSIAQGTRVMPADSLYDIIDLSTVWVLVDVYEINLPFARVGQPAEIRLTSQPGKVWRGSVTYIYPDVDAKTRTAKVRVELPNPGGQLKAEMYADVELKGSLGKALAVPESAVISTGERMIVFVAKEEGVFEPREVVAGIKVRNFVEVRSGLQAGEKVVTGANFLMDSESKLKAAAAGSRMK